MKRIAYMAYAAGLLHNPIDLALFEAQLYCPSPKSDNQVSPGRWFTRSIPTLCQMIGQSRHRNAAVKRCAADDQAVLSAAKRVVAAGLLEMGDRQGLSALRSGSWCVPVAPGEATTTPSWTEADVAVSRARIQRESANMGPVVASVYTRFILAADAHGALIASDAELTEVSCLTRPTTLKCMDALVERGLATVTLLPLDAEWDLPYRQPRRRMVQLHVLPAAPAPVYDYEPEVTGLPEPVAAPVVKVDHRDRYAALLAAMPEAWRSDLDTLTARMKDTVALDGGKPLTVKQVNEYVMEPIAKLMTKHAPLGSAELASIRYAINRTAEQKSSPVWDATRFHAIASYMGVIAGKQIQIEKRQAKAVAPGTAQHDPSEERMDALDREFVSRLQDIQDILVYADKDHSPVQGMLNELLTLGSEYAELAGVPAREVRTRLGAAACYANTDWQAAHNYMVGSPSFRGFTWDERVPQVSFREALATVAA